MIQPQKSKINLTQAVRHLPDKTATIPCRNKKQNSFKKFPSLRKIVRLFTHEAKRLPSPKSSKDNTWSKTWEHARTRKRIWGSGTCDTEWKTKREKNITVPLQSDVPKRETARDLSRHQQARTEKTTTCARIPLRTLHGPSRHWGPLKILKKSHNNNFSLFFFEVRFLHADPHRFVLLISLFHQMKGMPWMFPPSPLPWAPVSDVTPGRKGGGVTRESWWGCAARVSKSWPYFRPKNVILHTRTRLQTKPLNSIPVFRPGL